MKYTIFGFSQEQVLNLCDEHQSIDERDLMSAGGIGEQRIYSRIMDMCVPVPFNGSDRRRSDYAARTAAAKELLGL